VGGFDMAIKKGGDKGGIPACVCFVGLIVAPVTGEASTIRAVLSLKKNRPRIPQISRQDYDVGCVCGVEMVGALVVWRWGFKETQNVL
jgi:hypothetical protein